MYAREFTLRQGEILKIKKELNRIRLLFPQISIRFEKTENESRSKILWVTINGPSEEVCEAAKKYMTAMTSNETKVTLTIPVSIQGELLHNNSKILRDIESQNSVVIDLDIVTHEVSIQGEELEVVLARSLIDEHIEKFNKNAENKYDVNSIVKSLKEVTIDDNVKNFAMKLGYDESNIKSAAESCASRGIELNEDTLLKELTKQCPQNQMGIGSSVSESYPDEEFVRKTVAEYTSEQMTRGNDDLRGIVIDGSNIAMCHGHKQIFSCSGIEIVVNWFKQRGHTNIKVFVPQWRQETPKSDCPMTNQELLSKLEKEKIMVFTPSRRINGRRVVCYDDRYIVKYAVETDSIIVSNDNFRDLQKENPKWKQYLDLHILMYSFVNDMFMPPDDPLGRSGPNVDEFLKTGPYQAKICPYKNKCTYGSKCRYYHPQSNEVNVSDKQGFSCTGANPRFYGNNERDTNQYSSSNSISSMARPTTHMTCAAEMNAREQQSQYQLYDNDIIARGRSTASDNFLNGKQQHQMMRDWQQPQPNPQVYPTMNYYQLQQQPYQYQQQQNISQQNGLPPQPQNHHFYSSVPPSNNPPQQWNHYTSPPPQTFTLQPRNTPAQPPPPNQYYMSLHPSNNNSYQQSPQSVTPHVNMMNCNYADPRSMNNYYPPSATSHTLQPIETRNQKMSYGTHGNQRTELATSRLFHSLMDMFPGCGSTVRKVLEEHPTERDMNNLVSYVLNEQNP